MNEINGLWVKWVLLFINAV